MKRGSRKQQPPKHNKQKSAQTNTQQPNQKQLQRQFITACKADKHQEVAKLIRKGFQVNNPLDESLDGDLSSAGITPAMYACHRGSVGCLTVLADNNADLFAKNLTRVHDDRQLNWDAVTYAAHSNKINCIEFLLARGVTINDIGALCTASAHGHVETIQFICQRFPSLVATDTCMQLITHAINAPQRSAECVKALLDAGVPFNWVNHERLTPLMIAAGLGKAECVKALLAVGAWATVDNENNDTALKKAEQGKVSYIRENEAKFARNGNDINNSPRVLAFNKCIELINFQVKQVILFLAACKRDSKSADIALDLVINDGLNVHEVIPPYLSGEGIGMTPAMYACFLNNLTALQRLYDKDNTIVDSKNTLGHTALMRAAESGFAEGVQFLLERGAKVTVENDHRETALQCVIDSKAGYLRKYKNDPPEELRDDIAKYDKCISLIEKKLQELQPNARNSSWAPIQPSQPEGSSSANPQADQPSSPRCRN